MSTKKKTEEISEPVAPVQEPQVQESSEAPSASPQPTQILSQQDTQVSDLVKEQPKTVSELQSVNDLKMRDILELPEECKALHRVKYRYRWLAKNKNLEATLRSSIWALCTRSNSPYIKPHRFKSHGAVEQSGMLLAFATEDMGVIREAAPANKSASLVKHYTEDLPKQEERGFYQPDTADGADEGDGIEMD
jgi:hypothetical protein